jgi:hypothetical protein
VAALLPVDEVGGAHLAVPQNLTVLEASLLHYVTSVTQPVLQPLVTRGSPDDPTPRRAEGSADFESVTREASEATAPMSYLSSAEHYLSNEQVVRALGAPRAAVSQALAGLIQKLGSDADT